MNNPRISKIFIYPVKSFEPVELTVTEVGHYSLKHDRTFAIMGKDGRYINGKRTGKVNQLKTTYDLENGLIRISQPKHKQIETFELRTDNKELNQYLEDFFELKLHLVRSEKGALLDVPYRSCVTIISTATYDSLLQDFPEYTIDDFRLRFRANIEIEGVEAFWEEGLFISPTEGMCFKINNTEMIGMSPRARCNVPPRNPFTGKTDKTFIKKMMTSRENSLPTNSALPQFGNTYYLAVDAYLPPSETGKIISVGDSLQLGQTIILPNFPD